VCALKTLLASAGWAGDWRHSYLCIHSPSSGF